MFFFTKSNVSIPSLAAIDLIAADPGRTRLYIYFGEPELDHGRVSYLAESSVVRKWMAE